MINSMRACIHWLIGFRPPVITGMTTLNEGDTLYLDCDTSNSRPRPSVEWLSPERVVVSNERILEIMNIQRSATGIYTCVALSCFGATMNITVNITVQRECQVKHSHVTFIQRMREKAMILHIL